MTLALTAAGNLYGRVLLESTARVLPSYGVVLAGYGLGMVLLSRDVRCRVVYATFAVLVVAAFWNGFIASHARWMGMVEIACSLVLIRLLAALSADPRFVETDAVLGSGNQDR